MTLAKAADQPERRAGGGPTAAAGCEPRAAASTSCARPPGAGRRPARAAAPTSAKQSLAAPPSEGRGRREGRGFRPGRCPRRRARRASRLGSRPMRRRAGRGSHGFAVCAARRRGPCDARLTMAGAIPGQTGKSDVGLVCFPPQPKRKVGRGLVLFVCAAVGHASYRAASQKPYRTAVSYIKVNPLQLKARCCIVPWGGCEKTG